MQKNVNLAMAIGLLGIFLVVTGCAALIIYYPSNDYPGHWIDTGFFNHVIRSGGWLESEPMGSEYRFPLGGHADEPGNITTPVMEITGDEFTVLHQFILGMNSLDEEGGTIGLGTNYPEIPFEMYFNANLTMEANNGTVTTCIELGNYNQVNFSYNQPNNYYNLFLHSITFKSLFPTLSEPVKPVTIYYTNFTGYSKTILESALQEHDLMFGEQATVHFIASWCLNFTQGGRSAVFEEQDQSLGSWTFNRTYTGIYSRVQINGSFQSYWGRKPVEALVKNFPLLEYLTLTSGMVMVATVIIAGAATATRKKYFEMKKTS
ncbi:MAG: hypothetical protein ACFFD4_37905 [Candidatus Odinarchaeota archaeon]